LLKRILLTTDAIGGVWNYSMDLARGVAATRGTEIVLAVLGPAPAPPQRSEAATVPGLRVVVTGLPLDWLAETLDNIEFAATALAAIAQQIDADTVQLHSPALIGRTLWPVPVVALAHSCVGTWWQAMRSGPLPPDLAWRAEATRIGLVRADSVVAPSGSFANALRFCYGITRPITVVWNGRTPNTATATRQDHGLTAGRLWDDGKNISATDEAAGKLPWPVLAAGPTTGPNGARVSCRHLRLLGSLDGAALAAEYAKAAVFVSVSHYEPFGLAVLEAAQSGCALVLSDIPTFRELWEGAATFVPADAPDRIARAMGNLLGHPDQRARQSERALRRAATFDVRTMVDATLAVHRETVVAGRTDA
jgi:glycosyltransferase involved in cell wall biosynthesis